VLIFGTALPLSLVPTARAASAADTSTSPSAGATSRCVSVEDVAHRGSTIGLDVGHTEETLGAFHDTSDLAGEATSSGLTVAAETDIRRTKPNDAGSAAWINMHDPTLNRTTNGTGLVAGHTYQQIRQLRTNDGERVPRFGPVVSHLAGTRARLQVEIKPYPVGRRNVQTLVNVVKQRIMVDRLEFTSFHLDVLKEVRSLDPTIRLGLLANKTVDAESVAGTVNEILYSMTAGTDANIEAAHRAGLEVAIWTLDTEAEWKNAIAAGVDGIITDDARLYFEWCTGAPQSRGLRDSPALAGPYTRSQ
jgi:glycerophosphoryl diester phosphodiesterase